MKTNFNFLALAFLIGTLTFFTSCKEEEEIDIRDSYVGTYQGTETWINRGENYSDNISLTVAKSEVDLNKIVLTATFFKNTPEIVTAEVKNGDFSTSFTSVIDGVSVTVSITSGKFNLGKITYSYTAPGYVTITVNATKL